MSRLAREYPDQPELWANPPLHAECFEDVARAIPDVRARCADPRCGRRVSPTYGSVWCAEHDSPDTEIKDAS